MGEATVVVLVIVIVLILLVLIGVGYWRYLKIQGEFSIYLPYILNLFCAFQSDLPAEYYYLKAKENIGYVPTQIHSSLDISTKWKLMSITRLSN